MIQYDNNTTSNNFDEKYLEVDEDIENNFTIYSEGVFIYAWGRNKHGELGLSKGTNTNLPKYNC